MSRPSIPIWRKIIYAAVTVAALFLLAEGVCRLVLSHEQLKVSHMDPQIRHQPSVEVFLRAELKKVAQPHFPFLIPAAVIRAPPGTPGAFNGDPGRREVRHVPPENLARYLPEARNGLYELNVEAADPRAAEGEGRWRRRYGQQTEVAARVLLTGPGHRCVQLNDIRHSSCMEYWASGFRLQASGSGRASKKYEGSPVPLKGRP